MNFLFFGHFRAPRPEVARPSAGSDMSVLQLLLLVLFVCTIVRCEESYPPRRARPPEVIELENGATTQVVSLEEFLASQKSEDEAAMSNSSSSSRQVVHAPPSEQPQAEARNSKLAIVFTAAPPAQVETPQAASNLTSVEINQHGANNNSNSSNKPIPQHWQVKSLLNVTHDYPLAYSQIICGYVWPLMAALTLFTNLMIVFVLTQKDMRTPTNVVLTAIAIADIIPIVVPVPWFVYLFAMGNEKQVLYPPIACYFYQHSTRSISEIFYFLSTWLNVLLAIQDYLAACRPKLARKYCQIKVVVVEIVLLTLAAFLLNLPQALKLVFKPIKFYYNGQLTWGCRALQARWFKDLVGEYVALYDDIFTAIIVLFVDGGPAILLITLTALLIRQLHRQRIEGHKLMEQARTASKRRRERHRQQEYESSARVMIFVLLAFLAVKIPFATTYTLMIIQSRFEIHFVENLVDFQKAITITDLVFVLSYPINFTIFCCCSKKFRHKCAQLLGECNDQTKDTRERFMSSFTGSLESGASSFRASLSRRFSESQSNSQLLARRPSGPADHASQPVGVIVRKFSASDTQNHLKTLAESPTPPASSPTSSTFSSARALEGARTCDACEQRQAHDAFKSLVDNGSLCLECIVCYERFKTTASGAESSAPGELPQSSASAFLRRVSQASDSSASWSLGPPPLPPLKSLLTQTRPLADVPQIVTTTCESIRELQEGAGVGELPREERLHFGEIGQSRWELAERQAVGEQAQHSASGELAKSASEDDSSATGRRLGRSRSRDTDDREPLTGQSLAKPTILAGRVSSSDPGQLVAEGELAAQSRHRRQLSSSSSGGSDGELLSERATGTSTSARLDERSTISDQAVGAHASRRVAADSSKGAATRLSVLRAHFDSRQRSLSLSNSNLTTLPNATGMLADVLVSVLFAGQNGAGEGKKGRKQTR